MGYWEVDIQLGKTLLPKQDCLVTDTDEHKVAPIILGMNVLCQSPDELVTMLKGHLSAAKPANQQALQKTIKILQGQQRFIPKTGEIGKVRLTDGRPVKLQPNSDTILWGKARCGPNGRSYDALIEAKLIATHYGVVVASSLVTLKNGRVPIRVLNPHNRVVKLYRSQPLATLVWTTFQDVVHPILGRQNGVRAADNAEQPAWWEEIQGGDDNTPEHEKKGVLTVVQENAEAFSKDATDIGAVKAIYHRIPTGDAHPIKERHRPIAPALYQPVRQMLEEMRENGVI